MEHLVESKCSTSADAITIIPSPTLTTARAHPLMHVHAHTHPLEVVLEEVVVNIWPSIWMALFPMVLKGP